MGEILVEIMRPKHDMSFNKCGDFLGPFPSGAPTIFADTVARLGHSAGIIGSVGKDGFGENILNRLKKDGVNCENVVIKNRMIVPTAMALLFRSGPPSYLKSICRYLNVTTTKDFAIFPLLGNIKGFGYII